MAVLPKEQGRSDCHRLWRHRLEAVNCLAAEGASWDCVVLGGKMRGSKQNQNVAVTRTIMVAYG